MMFEVREKTDDLVSDGDVFDVACVPDLLLNDKGDFERADPVARSYELFFFVAHFDQGFLYFWDGWHLVVSISRDWCGTCYQDTGSL